MIHQFHESFEFFFLAGFCNLELLCKATPTPISDSEEVCPPGGPPAAGVTPGASSLSRGQDAMNTAQTDSNLNYSDDFTSSISISSAVPTPSAGGSQPLKDKTVLGTIHILRKHFYSTKLNLTT